MHKQEIKALDWLKQGLQLYMENFGLVFGACAVALILSTATLFVLLGPLAIGCYLILLRLIDKTEPRPELGDIFKGFEQFIQAFLFVLVWTIIAALANQAFHVLGALGSLLGLIFDLGLYTSLLYALPLMADRKLDFWPASLESIEIVKTNFFGYLLLALILTVLKVVGLFLGGIGIFFTFPLVLAVLAVSYRDITKTRS